MPLNVALVGAGQVASAHLEALAGVDAVSLIGLFDQDQARAQQAASAYAGRTPRVYPSWAALLADEAVQCVGILLPHDLHEQFTLDALQAGKHVVCEKPLGQSLAEMDRMLCAAADAGRLLLPVHNRLYSPGVERLLELVAAGHIGQVVLAQTTGFEGPSTVGVRPWLATKRGGGGVLIAQAVHPAYILRALLGDVARVGCQFGDLKVVDMTGEDTAVVTLKFRSGAIAEMAATFGIAHGPFEHSIVLHGRAGYAQLGVGDRHTGQRDGLQAISPALFGDTQLHPLEVPDAGTLAVSFRALWQDYARGMLDGAPTRVVGEDGRRAVEIILAAYRANASGRVVELPLAS